MSSPYGPPGSPADREPGEQPSYSPYGGPSLPYGPTGTASGTDPVSITGFVLSLLCCTSLIGLILGIVGLSRTKNGVRGGRWAAVSAVIIGAVGTLVGAGVLGFFVWFGTSTVSLNSADVGQCVNVDEFSNSNDATLFKKDCDEPHEAEIAVAEDFTSEQADAFRPGSPETVCEDLLADEYATAFDTHTYDLGLVFEATDPDAGDAFICYLERADGDDLEAPIGD